jgi:hypothetical protein
MKKIFIMLLITANLKTMAQSIIKGEYLFKQQEMVAGFKFSANGKFTFFYSYGSLDRHATGSFKVVGDTLKLKSDKEEGKDFTLIEESKQDTGYIIKCNGPNEYFSKYIKCIIFVDNKRQEFSADENGEVHIEQAFRGKIYLQNILYPDIPTLVKDETNENNRFTFQSNASLEQVTFKYLDFKIVNKHKLTCLHNYFMPVSGIEFIKQ